MLIKQNKKLAARRYLRLYWIPAILNNRRLLTTLYADDLIS